MKKFGIMTALVLALSIAGSAFASTETGSKSVLTNTKSVTFAKSNSKPKKHKKMRKAKKAPATTPASK
jgi:hypothetical protein